MKTSSFRLQASGFKLQAASFYGKTLLVSSYILFLNFSSFAQSQEKWAGMDQAVIEKYATEQGRPPAKPLVKIEGDALLFTFILAGAIGGFILGYNWHRFFKTDKGRTADSNDKNSSVSDYQDISR